MAGQIFLRRESLPTAEGYEAGHGSLRLYSAGVFHAALLAFKDSSHGFMQCLPLLRITRQLINDHHERLTCFFFYGHPLFMVGDRSIAASLTSLFNSCSSISLAHRQWRELIFAALRFLLLYRLSLSLEVFQTVFNTCLIKCIRNASVSYCFPSSPKDTTYASSSLGASPAAKE